MNDALGDCIDTCCLLYLDDLLVFSKDEASHYQDCRRVLERLRAAKLIANLKKCEFNKAFRSIGARYSSVQEKGASDSRVASAD